MLCNLEGDKDNKSLDEKPKNAVNWNKQTIQYIEEEYSKLVKPK